uniref:SBF2 domain-containing protein n=1 Tax=Macrostomum lignano TaxID=282301 RepID=A0A1I8HS21_9PLAT
KLPGRVWFVKALEMYQQQQQSRGIGGGFADRLDESAFYAMAQSLAAALMECSLAEDWRSARALLDASFVFYTMPSNQFTSDRKTYLYNYLKDQGIWQSQRFWTAAFADALEAEQRSRWG